MKNLSSEPKVRSMATGVVALLQAVRLPGRHGKMEGEATVSAVTTDFFGEGML